VNAAIVPTARNSDCQFCSVFSQKSGVRRYEPTKQLLPLPDECDEKEAAEEQREAVLEHPAPHRCAMPITEKTAIPAIANSR
jgi:hypothetical protein